MIKESLKPLQAKVALLTDREGELVDGFIEHLIAARRAIVEATLDIIRTQTRRKENG